MRRQCCSKVGSGILAAVCALTIARCCLAASQSAWFTSTASVRKPTPLVRPDGRTAAVSLKARGGQVSQQLHIPRHAPELEVEPWSLSEHKPLVAERASKVELTLPQKLDKRMPLVGILGGQDLPLWLQYSIDISLTLMVTAKICTEYYSYFLN